MRRQAYELLFSALADFGRAREASLAAVKMELSTKIARPEPRIIGRIGVVPIVGILAKSDPYDGGTSTRDIQRMVSQLAADPEIQGILLQIDSPGGEVAGIEETYDMIRAAGERKPVWSQIEDLGASGAYHIAMGASRIVANRPAEVGSIGVYLAQYDFSARFAADGIRPVLITTSEYKGAGLLGTEITPAQQAEDQRIVDQLFGMFRAAIRQSRGLTGAALDAVSDGRLWLAADALDLGLIDAIGSTNDTLAEMTREVRTLSRRAAAMAGLMSREKII